MKSILNVTLLDEAGNETTITLEPKMDRRGQKYGQEVMTRILSVLPSILPKNLKITNATLELYE